MSVANLFGKKNKEQSVGIFVSLLQVARSYKTSQSQLSGASLSVNAPYFPFDSTKHEKRLENGVQHAVQQLKMNKRATRLKHLDLS